jgi:ribonucleoside-diphosphate reductase alpha chain
MKPLFKQFLSDLNIPEEIVDSLKIPRTNQEMRVYALSLPKLLYPDTYILAGRLFIYLNIVTAPRTISDYVEVLNGLIRPEIAAFLKENEGILDELLEETYYKNFENQTILSASSCVNYLLKVSHLDPPIETPCQLMLRQAVQFYHDETIDEVVRCYRELIEQEYVHASPTMFNSGTRKNQLSSCFIINIGDNLEDILYSGVADSGMISKYQGGIGMSMNNIRHSAISNTGKSSGVLPFARISDAMIMCVDQGGKRNGAITISLNDWHFDFPDFVKCRDNYTHNGIRLKQANTSAFISSLFMERVKNNQDWTLFCPAKAKSLIGKRGDEFEKAYHLLEKEVPIRKLEFDRLDQAIQELEKKVNSDQTSDELNLELNLLISRRSRLRKNLIDHKVVKARDLYELICDMQVKSSFPYIVYADTINYKNNTMNIGPTESSNLCQEITLPSSPDSIASCNLGHLNLKKFVKKSKAGELYYDYNHLGRATQSLVNNIDKVIKFNYYPLDKRDKNGNVIEKGRIHKPNISNRPLGIGVSGLAEVFALFKIPYESEEAEIINKTIFACMYFNALYKSCLLAKEFGPYETFKTGESRLFVDGEFKTFKGSPLSNGFFQFDLWKQEADYLESIGRLNKEIYNREDDRPIPPREWGNDLGDSGGPKSWDALRMMILKHGVRNSMLLALMPTASSAQLLRNAETTEAHQTLIYSRKTVHGNYTAFSEPFVNDMVEVGIWNKKMIDFINMCNGSIDQIHFFVSENPEFFPDHLYVTVEEEEEINVNDWDGMTYFEWIKVLLDFQKPKKIIQKRMVKKKKIKKDILKKIMKMRKIHKGMYEISQKITAKMVRQRGIYVDQSQSFNCYLAEPNKETLEAFHMYTYYNRVKTGMYYLRANPASQTGKFTVDLDIQRYHAKREKEKGNKYICTESECLMCE